VIIIKNPNNYGSVYKQSGKRRKPYVARITIGWDENKKQIRKVIGYYETRALAMQALADYNKNPYQLETSTITFAEVFEKWKVDKFTDISQSNINGYKASFKASELLHNMRFVDIRTEHMKEVLRTCGKGHGTLRKIKVLYGQLFKFAMENDIVTKDYSKFVKLSKNNEKSSRKVFAADEIKRLFDIVDKNEIIDTILIMIYTGLRIAELLIIKSSDVNLEERLIIGGIKTEAGKDRIIPINNKIFDLVYKRVARGYDYFITRKDGNPFKYGNYYRENWIPLMEQLGFDHKPHDCRHTFATMMSNAGSDTVALQKIIGHASYQTTANVYTHKDIEQLKKAIDLI
jgi:integrase